MTPSSVTLWVPDRSYDVQSHIEEARSTMCWSLSRFLMFNDVKLDGDHKTLELKWAATTLPADALALVATWDGSSLNPTVTIPCGDLYVSDQYAFGNMLETITEFRIRTILTQQMIEREQAAQDEAQMNRMTDAQRAAIAKSKIVRIPGVNGR